MKPKINRIIENIFDIICNTDFKETAIKELNKDLNNKNISLDTLIYCYE